MSRMRSPTYGPRSLIRQLTARPLAETRTTVPSGSSLLAQVNRSGSYDAPLAVDRPTNPGPYQDAVPAIV
jgi:hypothetical protein